MPWKVKIYAWYARRGVILTKGNLVRRNWHGSTKCVFCPHDETIKHLFFECKVTCSIWLTIQIASNLYPPRSVANIFRNWLHGIDHKTIIRVGAVVVIWLLWFVEMTRFLMIKSFPFAGNIPVHKFAPFVVHIATRGVSRLLYGGVCATGDYGEGHFYPTWVAAWSSDWTTTIGGFHDPLICNLSIFCLTCWTLTCRLCASRYAEAGCNA